MKKLWAMVNNCETLAQVKAAEVAIKKANITNDEFDDLMIALSQISRELHR